MNKFNSRLFFNLKAQSKIFHFFSLRKLSNNSNNNSNTDSNGKINVIRLGNDDYKNFSKKFSPQEMEKYLDPYGFLNEYKGEYTKEEIAKNKSLPNNEVVTEKIINETASNTEVNQKSDSPIKNKLTTKEYGMKPRGPEPTRYGDWERNGKCVDF